MSEDDRSRARLFTLLALLWLGGITLRVTILAVPPVIPLIHDDLHLSETQVGLLMGLPLAMFAIAAIPGSLLVARFGALRTLVVGMVITALAGSGRGGAFNIWLLYATTLVMGFGIAIMQPALPTLVREWVPQRTVLGSAMASNGMLVGATLASIFTIPFVLPLVGGSWRLDLVVWSAPVLLIARGVHARPQRQHARARQCRRGAPVVARLEKTADLDSRPDLRQQQQHLLLHQRLPAGLPQEPGTFRSDQRRARLAQRRAIPGDVHPDGGSGTADRTNLALSRVRPDDDRRNSRDHPHHAAPGSLPSPPSSDSRRR